MAMEDSGDLAAVVLLVVIELRLKIRVLFDYVLHHFWGSLV
jgi:hypothetical protein